MESANNKNPFPNGALVISLDFELIWGVLDRPYWRDFLPAVAIERNEVITRLLALFDEFNVPATWLIVGHLFQSECDCRHRGLTPPRHAWHPEWFSRETPSKDIASPFVGRSLVEQIRSNRVPHEIGSHSYSHVIFDDPGCSEQAARSELSECVRLASELGLKMRSFAFPRNRVGHVAKLKEFGFTSYRGPDPVWYNAGVPERIRRALHLGEVLVASAPRAVRPERSPEGVWNIPGSMMFFPAHGVRRNVPMSLRVSRAQKGLLRAMREGALFHFWFHPTNLSFETNFMFTALRRILGFAADLQKQHGIEFLTMSQIVQRMESNL